MSRPQIFSFLSGYAEYINVAMLLFGSWLEFPQSKYVQQATRTRDDLF